MKIEFIREIEAPKDVVWSVIADFAAYAEWNPFVVACSSELRVGAPMAMTVRLGDRQREQVEFVSRVVEGELFEYRMKPVGPLLHSYRQHEVASQADGRTRYRSTFELNGWLAPLVGDIKWTLTRWLQRNDGQSGQSIRTASFTSKYRISRG